MSRLVAELQRFVKVFKRLDGFLIQADRGHSGTLPFSAQVGLEAQEKARRSGTRATGQRRVTSSEPSIAVPSRALQSVVRRHLPCRPNQDRRSPAEPPPYHNEPHPLIQVAMEPMHPYSSAHAVWIDATSPRPSSAIAWALSTCLRTLPVTVRGRDCTMAMCWGILK